MKQIPGLFKRTVYSLLIAGLAAAAQGATVVVDHGASWAGGVSGNQATIDFFNNNFSNVTVVAGDYSDTGSASVQAALAGADVLVLCRTTYSSGYSADDDNWYNANLSIPIICLTSYLSRTGKLGWESGDVANGSRSGNESTVTAAGAPVFGNAGAMDWWSGSAGFSAAGTGMVGDGDVLATIGGNHLVVGWESGDLSAAGNAFSGNRLVFNIPENGNSLPDTVAGQQALIDAVAAYTPLVPGVSTNDPGTGTTNGFLTVVEAESGTLGADFNVNVLNGVTNITITTDTVNGGNPGSAARVASYDVTFPEADTYQLYARLYVGPGSYTDDSFFYAKTFGVKSPVTDGDWQMINGLASAGFTSANEEVVPGGGAGTQVWKWVKWATYYTVSEGSLAQTFQIGAREDGLYFDKLVFGPADVSLTVQNLDDGTLPPPPTYSTNIFDGPVGMALHRFNETYQGKNQDGANPIGLMAYDGGLCGITFGGGEDGEGTVFTVDPDGSNFISSAVFSGNTDAAFPKGGLTASGTTLYGASVAGGANHVGSIFAVEPDGTVTVLHSFSALSQHTAENTGGAAPCAELLYAGGALYGAAMQGGTHGQGTLFVLNDNGTGFSVLHTFGALDAAEGTNADGAVPCGGLVLSGSTLYGTASGGGAHGAGVIFSVDINGTGFSVLHDFDAVDSGTSTNLGGAFPAAGLVLDNGILYGTAIAGGADGAGTVYSIQTDGSGFSVLHNFQSSSEDGAAPGARLVKSGNVLYGTTSAGGPEDAGTVFSVDVVRDVFQTLYRFESVSGTGTNMFGAYPSAPVLRHGNDLYGTAFSGGPGGAGTVFKLSIPVQVDQVNVSNGSILIDFYGAPNSTNIIQTTEELSAVPPHWSASSTNIADDSGWWNYADGTTSSSRFYRAESI